jgi:hypothetical protein
VFGSSLGLAFLSAILAQEAAPPQSTRHDVEGDQVSAMGVSSCAAFACHGGNGGEGDHRSAYTTWMALDPHSRAESVLKEKRSIDIEERLATFSGRNALRAETDHRCLGCHVSPGPGTSQRASLVSGSEGVGCESCHGPASKWLEPHSSAQWKQLSGAKKAEMGMTPTTELETRVKLCVACHVGGAGRDVDHDLIAAGHPRLDFEFLSYLNALPKHWDESKERRAQPDLDGRTWAIGQVVSAREALGLLSLRAHAAQDRQANKPVERPPLGIWPEFAEYSCNSCHHPLSETTLPSTRDTQTGLVTLPWGNWYFSIAPSLLTRRNGSENEGNDSPLASLRHLMESIDPEPKDVERRALEAQAEMGRLLGAARARIDLREGLRLLTQLVADGPGPAPPNREGATQRFLGLAALSGTLERLGHPLTTGMKSALDEIRRQVEDPALDAQPGRWLAEPFLKALERYRRELSKLTANLKSAGREP